MQEVKMNYNKRLGIFVREDEEYSAKELKEKRITTRKLMYALDKQAKLDEAKLRARGVCPYCHCILPISGRCDCQD